MLYRIFTENKDETREHLINIVAGYFPGFTWYETNGYYKHERERSLCIEIDSSFFADEKIKQLCRDICKANKQQSVLLQKISSNSEFMRV